jgi:uncharacterized iron-regulated membrane protein
MQEAPEETWEMQEEPAGPKRDWADRVREIGGLVAVIAGLLAITGIAIGALVAGTQTAATVAGSAIAVVGSVVGAYLGVKIGTDQTKKAIQGQQIEAAKAQVYASHMSEQQAASANATAAEAVEAIRAAR